MRRFAKPLVLKAMFVALILLFGMTPIGLIPLGFINVTILCVPVIVGTILLGLPTGLLLGTCFGLVSTLSVLGMTMTAPSALASALLAKSPVLALVMCFVPRLLVPVVAHLVYKLFSKAGHFSVKAVAPAAIAGSLTNTVFYLGLMLLFYKVSGLDDSKIVALITGTGLIAGGSEAVVAAVICSPLVYAIAKANRNNGLMEKRT